MQRQIYRLLNHQNTKITLRVSVQDYDLKPESTYVIHALIDLLESELDRNGYKLEITKKAVNDEN